MNLDLAGPLSLLALGGLACAALGAGAWRRRRATAAKRVALDADGAVTRELDLTMRHGAKVFHDFEADGLGIDHIVVAAQGVFAVSTHDAVSPPRPDDGKPPTMVFDGHALRSPSGSTEVPLQQADLQARELTRWLTGQLGQMVVVTPVLALPGWSVRHTGRSVVRVTGVQGLRATLHA
ncbi:MAG TPA: nuclease-related domain-containing protein, partial [Ancylobacter sp.]